jgi:hypothetical protein
MDRRCMMQFTVIKSATQIGSLSTSWLQNRLGLRINDHSSSPASRAVSRSECELAIAQGLLIDLIVMKYD